MCLRLPAPVWTAAHSERKISATAPLGAGVKEDEPVQSNVPAALQIHLKAPSDSHPKPFYEFDITVLITRLSRFKHMK